MVQRCLPRIDQSEWQLTWITRRPSRGEPSKETWEKASFLSFLSFFSYLTFIQSKSRGVESPVEAEPIRFGDLRFWDEHHLWCLGRYTLSLLVGCFAGHGWRWYIINVSLFLHLTKDFKLGDLGKFKETVQVGKTTENCFSLQSSHWFSRFLFFNPNLLQHQRVAKFRKNFALSKVQSDN